MDEEKSGLWKKNVTREVTIFPAVGVTESFGYTGKTFDIPFNYRKIIFVDNTWWYQENEYERIRNLFGNCLVERKNYVSSILKKQKAAGGKLKRYVKSLAVKKFSEKSLAKELERYIGRMRNFYAYWWIAIPTGEILEEKVRKTLAQRESGVNFEDLLFVRKELELVRERRLLMKIGLKAAKYDSYESLPPALKKELGMHARNFGWITTSYHIGKPYIV